MDKIMDQPIVYFEIFPWTVNFETGIELIDEQHKRLVDILNHLAAHLANRSSEIKLNEIFEELADYADYHFKSEEKIWAEYFKEDEWFINHEHTHGSFIEEIVALKNNLDKESIDDVVYAVVTFLSKWLAYHILDTDKRMAIAIKNIQAGYSLEDAKANSSEQMNGFMKVIVETVLTMYESLSARTLDLMREKSLRLQAEEALKRSEERWKFILEEGSENAWDWDIEHDKMTQSHNHPLLLDIHPSDTEEVNADLQAHLDGKTDFYINKHRILQKNGRWSWILTRGKVVSRDLEGKPLRMVGTHSDITERELASLIHKNTTQAIFVCDADKIIVSVNPAFTTITGYGEEEAIGANPRDILSENQDEQWCQEMWDNVNSAGHWSSKISNLRKNGKRFEAFLDINAVTDSNGTIDHYIGMFNDVTEEEERKKEQAIQKEYLLQHSRMAQMGELISMIAHQWKQPLSVISSISAELQIDLALNTYDLAQKEGQQECQESFNANLKKIEVLVGNLSTVMDDFRNFYNPNKKSNQALLSAPVDKALLIIRASLESSAIIIEEHYNSEDLVSIFENEIIQVVLNILKNAQDNFNEKKTPNPKIVITTTSSDDKVILEICDNGGGIPSEIMTKIFEPYFSTKSDNSGTGLGLHMSKMIVESHHNGKLYAQNRGDGICFGIEIPKV